MGKPKYTKAVWVRLVNENDEPIGYEGWFKGENAFDDSNSTRGFFKISGITRNASGENELRELETYGRSRVIRLHVDRDNIGKFEEFAKPHRILDGIKEKQVNAPQARGLPVTPPTPQTTSGQLAIQENEPSAQNGHAMREKAKKLKQKSLPFDPD